EEALMHAAHLGVASEKTKGTAFGDLEDATDAFGGFFGKVRFARVGHVGREIQQRLLFVVEGRGDDEFACGGQTEAPADVVEAAGDCEGSRGEDDGVVVVEERGGEEFRDVYRRCLQM